MPITMFTPVSRVVKTSMLGLILDGGYLLVGAEGGEDGGEVARLDRHDPNLLIHLRKDGDSTISTTLLCSLSVSVSVSSHQPAA
jgi:hypothetical protein